MSLHESQLQGGSVDEFNGPRQIYRPKPIILATSNGAGTTFTTTVVLPVPSSQTRIKLSVFCAFPNINAGVLPSPGSIWVSACDEDRSGTANGSLQPITNLDGTQAAPTVFPASNGLTGYSRSFVTTADWIQAVIGLTSVGEAPSCNWILQTSIQPEAVTFPWKAWDDIRRAFVPQNLGGQGSI